MRAVGACTELMEELDTSLRGRWSRTAPTWEQLGFPCIDRGAHAVFPLLVAEATTAGDTAAERDLTEITEHLWGHWGYRYGGHDFRLGAFRDDDVAGRKVLGDRLLASGTGVRAPKWWDIAGHVVIFATSANAERTSIRSALHLVPKEWIFAGNLPLSTDRAVSRSRSVARTVAAADLEWDWKQDGSDSSALWVTSRAGEASDAAEQPGRTRSG